MPSTAFTDDVALGLAEVSNSICVRVSKHARSLFRHALGDKVTWGSVLHDELHPRVVEFVLQGFQAL